MFYVYRLHLGIWLPAQMECFYTFGQLLLSISFNICMWVKSNSNICTNLIHTKYCCPPHRKWQTIWKLLWGALDWSGGVSTHQSPFRKPLVPPQRLAVYPLSPGPGSPGRPFPPEGPALHPGFSRKEKLCTWRTRRMRRRKSCCCWREQSPPAPPPPPHGARLQVSRSTATLFLLLKSNGGLEVYFQPVTV